MDLTLLTPLSDLADGLTWHPSVQLLHELVDESRHVDWLIATAGASGPLVCFRLPAPMEELPIGEAMVVERIADHRRVYLEYEGPVSGGRGRVARIARGTVRLSPGGDDGFEIVCRWSKLEGSASLRAADRRPESGDTRTVSPLLVRLNPLGQGRFLLTRTGNCPENPAQWG